MTIHAFIRRVLVNHGRLVADEPGLNMTFGARHVCMTTCQWEMSFCVVIERRRNPTLGRVTIATMRLGVLGCELPVVRVLVACLALLRRAPKSRGVFRRGFMTIGANDGAVGAQ